MYALPLTMRRFNCPRCKTNVAELPTECPVCRLTLVSSPHLARSYHHLFPVSPFEEVDSADAQGGGAGGRCFGCQGRLGAARGARGGSLGVRLRCPKCRELFCFDCDTYVHESLHNCPGCECRPANQRGDAADMEMDG